MKTFIIEVEETELRFLKYRIKAESETKAVTKAIEGDGEVISNDYLDTGEIVIKGIREVE